jgi:outer membrane protein TolC
VRSAAQGAARRALADAEQRRTLVEGRIQDGVRPPADAVAVQRFEAAARLEEAELRGARDAAREELALAVGAALPAAAEPDFSLLDRTPKRSASARSQPELDALRRKREAALATARVHDRGWYPILAAEGEAGVHAQSDQVFPAYQLGLSLSMPLWDGGMQRARAELARAEAMELSVQARQAEHSLSSRQSSLKRAFDNASERVTLADQVRALSAQELRNAEERYTLGRGSIEALLDARAALTRADSTLLLARLARAEAALGLAAEP